ncbi:MAG: hypothetical protein JRN06_01430 [Nitrososphaerota archaeon]|nr:hypothetical protein [Nitrososphaerota archaeon]MDG7023486.1 hypothetical protein [Nitrososphaerota archaeon]
MSGLAPEHMLAQDQGVISRRPGFEEELEAGVGVGEVEGTLILTNKRLIFVCTNEREDDLTGENALNPLEKTRFVYSEVEDLAQVPEGSPNIFIPISAMVSVKGEHGGLERASLEVRWNSEEGEKGAVFSEELMGKKKTLKDWAPVIENLKAGRQKLVDLPPPPPLETLKGRILRVLSDFQEKGVLDVEDEVETAFKVDLDPDEVQAACDELSLEGALRKYPDPSGDVYYRRASRLGEDDLSS